MTHTFSMINPRPAGYIFRSLHGKPTSAAFFFFKIQYFIHKVDNSLNSMLSISFEAFFRALRNFTRNWPFPHSFPICLKRDMTN